MITSESKHCPHCDGTGDVHRADGEWLGVCTCPAGKDMLDRTQHLPTLPRPYFYINEWFEEDFMSRGTEPTQNGVPPTNVVGCYTAEQVKCAQRNAIAFYVSSQNSAEITMLTELAKTQRALIKSEAENATLLLELTPELKSQERNRQQAAAWMAVVGVLNEVAPGWIRLGACGRDGAVQAIKELAQGLP